MSKVNPKISRRRLLQGAVLLIAGAMLPGHSSAAICVESKSWRSLYTAIMSPLESDFEQAWPVMQQFIRHLPRRDQLELSLGLQFLHGPWCWLHRTWSWEQAGSQKSQRMMRHLQQAPADLGILYLGIKDLCQLGHYANPQQWQRIGYSGPVVDESMDMREFWQEYESLRATKGPQ